MTKSRFMEKQPSAKVVEKDKVYVYICLNEKEFTEDHTNSEESSESITMYEYDYNEIIDSDFTIVLPDTKNPFKQMYVAN